MPSLASKVQAGCLILELDGEFRRSHFARLLNKVRHELEAGVTKVILNAKESTFATASVLGELAQLQQLLAEHGCRLILAAPTLHMRKMLVLSFLDKVITTASSVEEALAAE